MKNRLEIARSLLREDGSIWINIDDNEAHYLKILCDEVFGPQNFLANVVWQHSVQGKNDSSTLSLHHNYLLVYRRSNIFRPKLLPRTEKHNVAYSNPDNDPKGDWRSGDVRSPHFRENLVFVIITPSGKRIAPPDNGWRWSKELVQEKIDTGEIIFSDDETKIIRKIYLVDQEGRIAETIWFGDEVGTTREANREIKALFGDVVFKTPKPERLLQRIIHIGSNKNELILDFFSGSGTTTAVAHKTGRQYIGVEQMDYVETITVERLKKVISGEQGGISQSADWQGGGSFIYCELMRLNERFVLQIQDAKDEDALKFVWDKMQKDGFLSYKIRPESIKPAAKDFQELSFEEQQRFLIEVLDKNMLYVNYFDMDDEDYTVSDDDKRLTEQFYKLGK